MALLDTLEHRFGRFAIPGITRILVAGQALVFLLFILNPKNPIFSLLPLDREAVLGGQVWRLVTYLFLPLSLSPFFFLCASWVTWFVGDCLEQSWGTFKLNMFLLCGMFAITLASFVFDVSQTNAILMLTLFLAFAILAPDFEFLLFFVLPVKVKWLAWIDFGLLVMIFIRGGLGEKVSVAAGLANCFLFFGPQAIRHALFRQKVAARRGRFVAAVEEAQSESIHSCKVCGRTENSDPSLDFRIARDGEEYCLEHLPSRQT